MSQVVSLGGGNHSTAIFGNGTIYAGNGDDKLYISGHGLIVAGNGMDTLVVGATDDPKHWSTVIGGSGADNITVHTNGLIQAGDGNDTLTVCENGHIVAGNGNTLATIDGRGSIRIGDGNDTLTLKVGGKIVQSGASGHDTIDVGRGNDTIYEQGHATVYGAYSNGTVGTATIDGGQLQIHHSHGITEEIAVSGKMTLTGTSTHTEFVGGKGTTVMNGGSGHDTFVGGSGQDTMVGTGDNNVFEFLTAEKGGSHVIQNFVSGDKLYLEGQSFSYLESHHDISSSGGNTFISIDGGMTTIELKGVSGLSSSDIITHKA